MKFRLAILTIISASLFTTSVNTGILAQSQVVGQQEITQEEQQLADRDTRIDKFTKFFTESLAGIILIVIFTIFLAVASYLALGVIFLVFFGGIGGK